MQSPRSHFVRPPSTAITLLLVLVAWVVLIGSVVILHYWRDVAFGFMTRDPADVFDVPFYLGFLSLAAGLLWTAAATACLFSALALPRQPATRDIRRFLFAFGLLTLLLAVDDAFLLHDRIFPEIGIPENLVYAGYGAALLVCLWFFRSLILKTQYLPLLLAALFMGISIAVDVFAAQGDSHYLAEDSAKVAGILCWLAYFFRVALVAVQNQLAAQDVVP